MTALRDAMLEVTEDWWVLQRLEELQQIVHNASFDPPYRSKCAKESMRLHGILLNRQGMLFDAWGGWV